MHKKSLRVYSFLCHALLLLPLLLLLLSLLFYFILFIYLFIYFSYRLGTKDRSF